MAPHADGDVAVTATSDISAAVIPDPVLTKNPTETVFGIDDVIPHRKQAAPMPSFVAAFGSADMFKSEPCFTRPKAKRFDHRFSEESASRKASSLKGAMKYFTPEMISLCGGLPSSDYFPFEKLSVRVPQAPGFSESDTSKSGIEVSGGKHDVKNGSSLYDLSICLNYGQSMGPPQLLRYFTEHTEIVHNPKYSDWDVAITIGSTSALELALRMFCTRGDFIITEEFSFSSAIETMVPQGLTPVGIPIDEFGMCATSLDRILSEWDESARGGAKPFVVYFVPTGQNPSGATQSLERRKAIYAVAEKHDLILLEDEPYYFLQMEDYVKGVVHEVKSPFNPTSTTEFLQNLIPSYLSLDVSGRVLRMDSMSKIIAPGSRTGWVTGPKQIIERFIRHQEVSSQSPSGFAEMSLYKLLEEAWGHKGFLEWLMYIRAEYTRRRDIIVNACHEYVPTQVASWVPPKAGMFHWIKVDASKHPGLLKGEVKLDEIEEKVFLAAVAMDVLVARGSWFWAEKDNKPSPSQSVAGEALPEKKKATDLFFRMTYAAATEQQMTEAVKRFGQALRTEFGLSA